MRFTLPVFGLGILASGLMLRPSVAATPSATFGVSATVQTSCRAASANAIAFRTYAAKAANPTYPVSVTCSNFAPYNVDFSAGMGFGATAAIRQMIGLGAALPGYALSSSPRGIVNRGHTAGTDAMAGAGNGAAQVLVDQGQISEGQYVAPGAHADSIIVTVTY